MLNCMSVKTVFEVFMFGSYKKIVFLVFLVTISSLSSQEKSVDRPRLIDKTSLKAPASFTKQSVKSAVFDIHMARVTLCSRSFEQGDLAYLEIVPQDESNLDSIKITYYGKKKSKRTIAYIPVTRLKWGYRAFIPLDPDSDPGKHTVSLYYKANGREVQKNLVFKVLKRNFEKSTYPLYFKGYSTAGKLKPETKKFIEESRIKKDKAFASREDDYINNSLSHPRDMHYITSSFWAKRTYKRYRRLKNGKRKRLKDTVKIHRGIDLRGKRGTPVYAMARGKIVLADKLYYEGNMVIIDHGNRIFSYYMHLDSFSVNEGDIVSSGCELGTVGSTGRSTAPHLHVSLVVAGVQVDPLSLLVLPIR